jgi:hypothetical protein
MRPVAARSSALLYEPRRRLPEMPSTLVMNPPVVADSVPERAAGTQPHGTRRGRINS